MRDRAPFLVVAAALLLAACGSSSAKTGSATPPTTAASNTSQQLAADKTLAKKAVLRLSDLPSGFRDSPSDDSDSSDDIPAAPLAKFATCAHVSVAEAGDFLNDHPKADVPSAKSDFSKNESTRSETDFESRVDMHRSESDLTGPLAVLSAKLSCWRDLFQTAFTEAAPKDTPVSGVTVSALPVTGIDGRAAGFRVRTRLATSDAGATVPVTLDFYLVGTGRAAVSLFGSGFGQRADATLEHSLLEKVVDRLDAAGG